jgi:hypothetical protein
LSICFDFSLDYSKANKNIFEFNISFNENEGTLLVAQLVEALRYKPEGRGFDSRWCH